MDDVFAKVERFDSERVVRQICVAATPGHFPRIYSANNFPPTPRSRSPSGYDRASAHSRKPGVARKCYCNTKLGLVGESPTLPEQSGAYSAQGPLPCVQGPE